MILITNANITLYLYVYYEPLLIRFPITHEQATLSIVIGFVKRNALINYGDYEKEIATMLL